MHKTIWFRTIAAVVVLMAGGIVVMGWWSGEVAGRVVEDRLVRQTVRRTGAFLQEKNLPLSDRLMIYLRELHGAHFVIARSRDGRLLASSFPDASERAGALAALEVAGVIDVAGRGYRYASLPIEPTWDRPDGEREEVRLYALVSRDEFHQARTVAAERIARVAAPVLLGAVVLSAALAGTIVLPLHRLSREMTDLADRAGQDLPPVGGTARRGPAEIVRLSRAFDRLMGRLADARRQLARQERLAALGQMSACVVHELRNPLSGIRMNLRVLADEVAPDGAAADSLQAGLREIERMGLYLEELTDLSASAPPGKGPTPLALGEVTDVGTDELIGSVLHILSAKADHAKVALCPIEGGKALAVRVDPGRVRQVLMNLLSNALQATPSGGRIEITARRQPPGSVRFGVRDTGGGVDPAIADDLFEPFVTGRDRSAGLGLYVSRRIVEAHGGRIGFEQETEGTVFWFEVPASPARDQLERNA
jgi:signal transduction histidine kinase